MFLAGSPMKTLSAFRPGRSGPLRTMQNTDPYQSQFPGQRPLSAIKLVETPGTLQAADVSAAWRKLLMQAEMAAPHVQVASIEGESGVGKQTLARYLLGCSPLSSSAFQRWDAREWLLTETDPAAITGFTYLDRVDLLAPPGQGLLLGILKRLQDRVPGRLMLVASSQSSLRQMAGQGLLLPDLAFRLTAVRFAIPPCAREGRTSHPLRRHCSTVSAHATSASR
jgi:DNA-binding NtrC family response regulator